MIEMIVVLMVAIAIAGMLSLVLVLWDPMGRGP